MTERWTNGQRQSWTVHYNREPRRQRGLTMKKTHKNYPSRNTRYPSQVRAYQASNVSSKFNKPNCTINCLQTLEIPFVKNNMVIMTIKGKQLPVLVDSGATMSIASTDLLNLIDCDYVTKISASGLGKAITANGN